MKCSKNICSILKEGIKIFLKFESDLKLLSSIILIKKESVSIKDCLKGINKKRRKFFYNMCYKLAFNGYPVDIIINEINFYKSLRNKLERR